MYKGKIRSGNLRGKSGVEEITVLECAEGIIPTRRV
jgi:hypothetical protein